MRHPAGYAVWKAAFYLSLPVRMLLHIVKKSSSSKSKDTPKMPDLKKGMVSSAAESSPLISIIVSVCDPDMQNIKAMIESVRNQIYLNWELCTFLTDSCSKETIALIRDAAGKDSRIRTEYLNYSGSECGMKKGFFDGTSGEYITMIDQEDLLVPDALETVFLAIYENGQSDIFYSDEDKIPTAGGPCTSPLYKPDWNPDLLRSYNYISHLLIVRKQTAALALRGMADNDGINEYDYVLRVTELAGNIIHIPQILYHSRLFLNRTENQKSQEEIHPDKAALEAHLKRIGWQGSVEYDYTFRVFNIRYELKCLPLVSVIIPNSEHKADLKRCLDSIAARSTYRNFEIIIAENNSTSKEIFAYYDFIQKQTGVRVIISNSAFNYSRINNHAVQSARGEILIFLNNDTEIISPDWIEQMLSYIQRDDVGCVGARMYYADGTIQHAGVVLGFKGLAGHAFSRLHGDDPGYMSRAVAAQDVSAVTGACMMIARSLFEAVGGFDERLRIAFNDIDLCMKVRQKNKLIIYNPKAELYHYESVSRGAEDTIRKKIRFLSEVAYFQRIWRTVLAEGDPYYNPHLDLEQATYRISGK